MISMNLARSNGCPPGTVRRKRCLASVQYVKSSQTFNQTTCLAFLAFPAFLAFLARLAFLALLAFLAFLAFLALLAFQQVGSIRFRPLLLIRMKGAQMGTAKDACVYV